MRTVVNAAERFRSAASPDLLDVQQVGSRLGCGRTRVFALLAEGALPSTKIGRRRLVAAADVERYLEQHRALQ